MNRRILITIGTVVIASLMAIIIWLTFFRSKPVDDLPDTSIDVGQVLISEVDDLPPPSEERVQREEDYPLGVKQLAFSFAERYGSYSNHAPGEHIDDLTSLMTLRMQREIVNEYEQDNLTIPVYDAYETRALNGDLDSVSDEKISVLVNTQRSHYVEGLDGPDIFYQDILVELIKFGDEWKVDGVSWYPRE